MIDVKQFTAKPRLADYITVELPFEGEKKQIRYYDVTAKCYKSYDVSSTDNVFLYKLTKDAELMRAFIYSAYKRFNRMRELGYFTAAPVAKLFTIYSACVGIDVYTQRLGITSTEPEEIMTQIAVEALEVMQQLEEGIETYTNSHGSNETTRLYDLAKDLLKMVEKRYATVQKNTAC